MKKPRQRAMRVDSSFLNAILWIGTWSMEDAAGKQLAIQDKDESEQQYMWLLADTHSSHSSNENCQANYHGNTSAKDQDNGRQGSEEWWVGESLMGLL